MSPVIIAEKIMHALEGAVLLAGHQLYLTASIGITIYTDDGLDTQTLLKNADVAMYKAKSNGKNNYQFYTSEMTDLAYARVQLETELRQAIENEEFVVYYQPQVDALNHQIIGIEALIRWQHPTRGLLKPDAFLLLAKDLGFIVNIDRWMMAHSIKQLKKWQMKKLNTGYMALNLSIKHLLDENFLKSLKSLLLEYNCDKKYVHLEISEEDVMENPEHIILLLQEISNLGITLSLDDFGTGYSSLSYLKRLPVDSIKIDRTFIKELPFNEQDAEITKAIIALSRSLHFNIIAEGVERVEQKDFLIAQGCHWMQGYLCGKPMAADDMESFLKKYSP